AVLMVTTIIIKPDYGAYEWNTLTLAALPLAFAAAAQTMVVLSGGIDLSVGPLMALANVLALRAMLGHDLNYSLGVALIVLLEVTLAGALNGAIIVLTRVPDIVVTLATSFIWAGLALLVLAKPTPGIPLDVQNLAQGSALSTWVPNALLLLLVVPLVWIPLRRSRVHPVAHPRGVHIPGHRPQLRPDDPGRPDRDRGHDRRPRRRAEAGISTRAVTTVRLVQQHSILVLIALLVALAGLIEIIRLGAVNANWVS